MLKSFYLLSKFIIFHISSCARKLEPAAVKYDVVTRQIGADVSQNQGEICKLTLDGFAPILALFCVSERIFSAHKLAFSLGSASGLRIFSTYKLAFSAIVIISMALGGTDSDPDDSG